MPQIGLKPSKLSNKISAQKQDEKIMQYEQFSSVVYKPALQNNSGRGKKRHSYFEQWYAQHSYLEGQHPPGCLSSDISASLTVPAAEIAEEQSFEALCCISCFINSLHVASLPRSQLLWVCGSKASGERVSKQHYREDVTESDTLKQTQW